MEDVSILHSQIKGARALQDMTGGQIEEIQAPYVP